MARTLMVRPMARTPHPSLVAAVALAAGLLLSACTGGSSADGAATTTTTVPETTTTTEPPLEAGTQLFVFNPSVGDCYDHRTLDKAAAGNGQTAIILLLDCSLPHTYEIFAVVDYPNTTGQFPGEDALMTFAKQQCPPQFEPYVGKAYETSELELAYELPAASNWTRGARPLGCALYLPNEKLVGSMQGSGR